MFGGRVSFGLGAVFLNTGLAAGISSIAGFS